MMRKKQVFVLFVCTAACYALPPGKMEDFNKLIAKKILITQEHEREAMRLFIDKWFVKTPLQSLNSMRNSFFDKFKYYPFDVRKPNVVHTLFEVVEKEINPNREAIKNVLRPFPIIQEICGGIRGGLAPAGAGTAEVGTSTDGGGGGGSILPHVAAGLTGAALITWLWKQLRDAQARIQELEARQVPLPVPVPVPPVPYPDLRADVDRLRMENERLRMENGDLRGQLAAATIDVEPLVRALDVICNQLALPQPPVPVPVADAPIAQRLVELRGTGE